MTSTTPASHTPSHRSAPTPTRTPTSAPGRAAPPRTRALARMAALGRAELTLLCRNRSALFTALVIPVAMVLAMRSAISDVDLEQTELAVNEVVMTSGPVMVLVFVVYANLISTYVARREELVLKRLRTGEVRDPEILAGTAVPAAVLALGQSALLVAAGAVLLDLRAPQRPDLLLAGLLLGVVLMAALAAATAAVTRSPESAQITALPLTMVSFVTSGMFVPLELMPDALANTFRLLPATPVVDLVRGGWLGDVSAVEALRALGLAAAWTALAVWVVRRWFRWEPRR